jgi:hypothetical protein
MADGTEVISRRRSVWSTGGRLVGGALLGALAWFLAFGLVLSVSPIAHGESGNLGTWILTLAVPPLLGSLVFSLVRGPHIKWQYGLYFGLCVFVIALVFSSLGTRDISYSYSYARIFLGAAEYVVLGGLGGQLAQATQLALGGRDGQRVRRLKAWHIGVCVTGALLVAVIVAAQFVDLSE